MNTHCLSCNSEINPEWFYCPNCGKQQREEPIVISLPKQALIYLVSFFLAPFGLGWGLKYIRSADVKVRLVGIISILLTIISIILMIFSFKYFMDEYTKTLNGLMKGQVYQGILK